MKIDRRKKQFLVGCSVALLTTIAACTFLPSHSIRITFDDRDFRDVPNDKSEAVKRMFDGQIGIDTIKNPDRVDAYRIGPPRRHQRAEDFPILTGPVGVPDRFVSEVTTALLSPDSYKWETVKGCLPEYGVCLSFYSKGERVDLYLCLECDIMMIAHNGIASGGEDFDNVASTIVRVVKALFPTDSKIQSLHDN